jgi:hypothetical protein
MRKQTLEIKDIFLIFLASVALLAAASILLRLVIADHRDKLAPHHRHDLGQMVIKTAPIGKTEHAHQAQAIPLTLRESLSLLITNFLQDVFNPAQEAVAA